MTVCVVAHIARSTLEPPFAMNKVTQALWGGKHQDLNDGILSIKKIRLCDAELLWVMIACLMV